MHSLISILGIIITIFFVVGTHEAAHFLMARRLGIRVLRFSIGFGKTLVRWMDSKGTEYVISLIPLGGYVKMLDENEGDVKEEDRRFAYNRQPYYKKFLVVLAGPAMNIFCAAVLYWLIFMIGFTTLKPIIGEVTSGSIAEVAGLKSQQTIVSIDHHPINGWAGFILRLIAHAGDKDKVAIGVTSANNPKETIISVPLEKWELDGLTPDPLSSLGIAPYMPPIPLVIGFLQPKSPAAVQLKVNDKIIAIDKTPIKTWEILMQIVLNNPDTTKQFTIERDHKQIELPVHIGSQRNFFLQKSGYLGIGPEITLPENLQNHIQYGPIAAMPHAIQQLYDFTYFNFVLIGKLFTGKLSLQSLGGPITIFDSAGTALNIGLLAFIGFLAFLSISIGVINLLPIPGLDGGHLFIQTIEAIIRRPIPDRVLDIAYRFGFLLLFMVLATSLLNDILRLF